jgi:alkaline phosphatase D
MTLSRRRLLSRVASLTPLLAAPPLLSCQSPPTATVSDGRRLFTLGVASGEPTADGIVLWTRLARDPLHGGGMGNQPVEVDWEIATDDKMTKIVRKGRARAEADFGHSIHVEVEGLEPGHWYWYRFRTPDEESIIGRTRTAPAPGRLAERLRFAVASCQNYEYGYYTAHRRMAEDHLDLVLFLGDYIYEGTPTTDRFRRHLTPRADTLETYRNRHALYRMEAELQACHAAFPWIVAPDDHEVANNYAGDLDGAGAGGPKFLERKAAAYQAYYEHMPLRRASLPQKGRIQLYRRFNFGGLVRFDVLDTRQYRDALGCRGNRSEHCEITFQDKRSILGAAQEKWLYDGFAGDTARWNAIAQQVMLMHRKIPDGNKIVYNMDKWDGYVANRKRLLGEIQRRRVSNPVVLSGDVHECWMADLKSDEENPSSATLASEFVCTSISSNGDGRAITNARRHALELNPHIHFYNGLRGYLRCEVTPDLWRTDAKTLDFVTKPGAPIKTGGSYVIENGQRGLKKA